MSDDIGKHRVLMEEIKETGLKIGMKWLK